MGTMSSEHYPDNQQTEGKATEADGVTEGSPLLRSPGNDVDMRRPIRCKTRLITRSRSVSELYHLPDCEEDRKRYHSNGGYMTDPSDVSMASPALSTATNRSLPSPERKLSRSRRESIRQEAKYSELLQNSAERVLSKLKTRQQAISLVEDKPKDNSDHSKGRPTRYTPVPRKLEPLFAEGDSTSPPQAASR